MSRKVRRKKPSMFNRPINLFAAFVLILVAFISVFVFIFMQMGDYKRSEQLKVYAAEELARKVEKLDYEVTMLPYEEPLQGLFGEKIYGVGQVHSTAIANNQEWMAAATAAGVFLWDDMNQAKPQWWIRGFPHTVTAMQFDRDAKALYIGNEVGDIYKIDLQTKKTIFSFNGHAQNIREIKLSRSGENFFTRSTDFYVKMWDTESGAIKQIFHSSELIASMSISPDGECLALLSFPEVFRTRRITRDSNAKESHITLFHCETGEQKAQWILNRYAWSIQYTPDGSQLITDGLGGVQYWNGENGKLEKEISLEIEYPELKSQSGFDFWVESCISSFSPDGKTYFSGMQEKPARVYDLETQKVKYEFDLSSWNRTKAAFSPNWDAMLTCKDDGAGLSCYDLGSFDLEHTYDLFTSYIRHCMFVNEDETIEVYFAYNKACQWDRKTGEMTELKLPKIPTYFIRYSPRAHRVMGVQVTSDNGRVEESRQLVAPQTGRLIKELEHYVREPGSADVPSPFRFSHNGDFIYSSPGLNIINKINSEDGELLSSYEIEMPTGTVEFNVSNIISSPDDENLIIACDITRDPMPLRHLGRNRAKYYYFFNMKANKVLWKLKAENYGPTFYFSPNGEKVYKKHETLSILDAKTGNIMEQYDFPYSSHPIQGSHHGKYLVMHDSQGKTINFLVFQNDPIVYRFFYENLDVSEFAFSSDDQYLLIGTDEGVICLWKINDFKQAAKAYPLEKVK